MNKRSVQKFSAVSASRESEQKRNAKEYKEIPIKFFENLNINDLEKGLKRELSFPVLNLKNIRKKYGDEFINQLPKGYTLSKFLGKGAFGQTFSACKSNFECIAVKVIELRHGDDELHDEFEMQQKFHEIGLAPSVLGKPKFYTFSGKRFGIIVMEQIDGVLDQLLNKNLEAFTLDDILISFLDIVNKLKRAGYAHRDAHPGNISFNYKKMANGDLNVKLNLIDFGHSQTGSRAWPDLEIIQFIRTLSMKDDGVDEGVTQGNQDYLFPRLLSMYQKNFNRYVETEEEIEEEFNNLFEESNFENEY
jgi:serine/threonine protein kinase